MLAEATASPDMALIFSRHQHCGRAQRHREVVQRLGQVAPVLAWMASDDGGSATSAVGTLSYIFSSASLMVQPMPTLSTAWLNSSARAAGSRGR